MATTTPSMGLTAKGVPKMPMWLTIVRGVTIAMSLGALIAAAYNISLISSWARYYGGSGPAGLIIFSAIFTWIILGCMLAAEFFAPQLYIRYIFFGTLVISSILWLAAWTWAAAWTADFYHLYNSYYISRVSELDAWGGSMAAAVALGAVTWILTVVTTVFFVKACVADPTGSTFVQRPRNDPETAEPKPETTVTA
ncbi:hypothetical protein FG05_05324 [Fusarium graminearum]|nr:hypothetical protein FG05_05324 [Fusarium graminearum]